MPSGVSRWLKRTCHLPKGLWLLLAHEKRERRLRAEFERRSPPLSQGRTFNEWLDDVFCGDEEECQASIQAILAMGEAAVPFLVGLIRFGPGDLPERALEAAREVVRQDPLQDIENQRYQHRFERLFRVLTPFSETLADELAPLLSNPFLNEQKIARAMAMMGGSAEQILLATAQGHEFQCVREAASAALADLAKPAGATIEELVRLLSDPAHVVRAAAIQTLSAWAVSRRIQPSDEVSAAVFRALGDSHEDVSHGAVAAIVDWIECGAIPRHQQLPSAAKALGILAERRRPPAFPTYWLLPCPLPEDDPRLELLLPPLRAMQDESQFGIFARLAKAAVFTIENPHRPMSPEEAAKAGMLPDPTAVDDAELERMIGRVLESYPTDKLRQCGCPNCMTRLTLGMTFR
jgi:hypothetical protein